MGRETKNFRQSSKSRSGNDGARQYAKINRQEGWRKPNPLRKGEKI